MADLGLPESKATAIKEAIEHILTENKIWYSITTRKEPGLKYIEFTKISIRIAPDQ